MLTVTSIRASALDGLHAWLAYAAAESWFLVILPWLTEPASLYDPLHPGVTLALFAVYPLIGLLAGTLVTSFLNAAYVRAQVGASRPRLSETCAVLSLVLAVGANAVFCDTGGSRILLLGFIMVAAALLLMTASANIATRLRMLADPWVVSLVLVGMPWLRYDMSESHRGRLAVAFALVLLVAACAKSLWRRTTNGPENSGSFRPAISLSLFTALTVVLSAAAAAPPAGAFVPTAQPVRAQMPNVILITMTGVRADRLSGYGYRGGRTVNLDALAADSAVYMNAVSSADMSLPAHASIFTGLYPGSHGARFGLVRPIGSRLDNKFLTLAEVLSAAGYYTAAVVADHAYLRSEYGVAQGFAHYDDRGCAAALMSRRYYLRGSAANLMCRSRIFSNCHARFRSAEEINESVLGILPDLARKQPFFLFLNYMDAAARPHSATGEISSVDYDKHLADIDSRIGAIVGRLQKMGLYNQALLVVTSPNGVALGERNMWGDGVSVYEDLVHVPLIMKYPHQAHKGRLVNVVSTAGIMPEVLNLLALSPPKSDVEALRSDFSGAVLSESGATGQLMMANARFQRIQFALRIGPLKFVRYERERELYDLSVDPQEAQNLCPERPDSCLRFEEKLQSILSARRAPEWSTARPDSSVEGRLRSLNYLQ